MTKSRHIYKIQESKFDDNKNIGEVIGIENDTGWIMNGNGETFLFHKRSISLIKVKLELNQS